MRPLPPTRLSLLRRCVGPSGVPANATAVAVNLTTANATGTGFLEAYATGSAPSWDTQLSFNSASPMSSLDADVPLSGTGSISVAVHGAAAVLVEVTGYYTPGTSGETYHTVNPTRLVDTRSGLGGFPNGLTSIGPVPSFGTYTLPASSLAQITTARQPTLAAQLTVTDTSGGAGYMAAYPTAGGNTGLGNVNWPAGGTIGNLTLTPTDSSGSMSVYNHSNGSADLVVDCSGYFD